MKTRGGELTGADTVRGVPEGVQEQLQQLKVGYSLIMYKYNRLVISVEFNFWGNGH